MADKQYWEFFDLLDQVGGVLEQLTGIAGEKAEAVRHGDLEAVNDCMKREQVLSLSLRTMEMKREKLVEQLGLGGAPLSGMPGLCPEPVRIEARKTAERLRNQYDVYNAAAGTARNLLELDLHEIEKHAGAAAQGVPSAGGMADIRA